MKHMLRKYFNEKQLINTEWMINRPTISFLVDSRTIQEVIIEYCNENEQLSIWKRIQLLEYENADINQYLYRLAHTLTDCYSYRFQGQVIN